MVQRDDHEIIWQSISKLRETKNNLSLLPYAKEYADCHKCDMRWLAMGGGTITIKEPIDIRIVGQGEIEFCMLHDYPDRIQQPATYRTKIGTFVTNDQGEFGGEITLPNGKKIGGNYRHIIECGNRIYAIWALAHLMAADLGIDVIDESLEMRTIYALHSRNSLNTALMEMFGLTKDKQDENFRYGAHFVAGDILYVAISGCVGQSDGVTVKCTRILKIQAGTVAEVIELPTEFRRICSLIIDDGMAYVSMDKMIAKVNMVTREYQLLTPLSVEDEEELMRDKD